jgi:3-hydroxyisobutyrate dehydrogenase-like beta-hydroxyacid dehydrogenase
MRVGFIGLGSQGGPMARRIVEAGYQTTLWARRPASLEAYADTAAKTAQTPAELAAASDLVCLCVVADADVEQVLTGPQGVLAGIGRGSVIAVHSTVHPKTCQRLDALAREHGAVLVDAPVSGGGMAAEAGRLLVMVGGEAEAVERCRPVFAAYGDPVVHMGPLGAGQTTKLLNNVLFTANYATAAGLLDLGASLGVDSGRLAQVIQHGTASSFALTRIAAAPSLQTALSQLGTHAGGLLHKDVGLIAELLAAAGAPGGIVLEAADTALGRLGHPR